MIHRVRWVPVYRSNGYVVGMDVYCECGWLLILRTPVWTLDIARAADSHFLSVYDLPGEACDPEL